MMENIKNPDLNRLHDITINEVKSFPIFALFSEEQASEVIETIKRLTEIVLCDYYKKEQNNNDK